MALWEAGGQPSPAILPFDDTASPAHDLYYAGGKRRVSCSEGADHNSDWVQIYKRPKYADIANLSTPPAYALAQAPTPVESVPAPAREVAFFVRPYQPSPGPPSEYQSPDRQDLDGFYDPEPGPEIESEPISDYTVEHDVLSSAPSLAGGACAMERTASGLSISSGITHTSSSAREQEDLGLLGDLEAAQVVREHLASFVRRSRTNSRHERILRTLINPKNRVADFPIDEAALESIFSAADAIFFASRLSNRVTWDWSHKSAPQYQNSVIGTTALRKCKELSGYEALIVLSRPILMSKDFSRRLLISTFLHELIHSYLFISCGFRAKEAGGHTEGFHQIAAMIDCWAGPEHLRLREMEADLESYREEQEAQDRYACPQGEGSQRPYERPQLELPFSLSESEGRFPRSNRHPGDSHVPILRDQPHRLLQSRSQASLRRRLNDGHRPQKLAHHHYHYTHRETDFRCYGRDESWESWIDDRWDGNRPAHTRTTTVPILVPVSVPATMPIRASLETEGAVDGVYVGYNT